MERIHCEVFDFLNDELSKKVDGVELNHSLTAYLWSISGETGNIEFQEQLRYCKLIGIRVKELTAQGLPLSEVTIGKWFFEASNSGNETFREVMFRMMGHELEGEVDLLSMEWNNYLWVALAYFHKDNGKLEQVMADIAYAQKVILEMKQQLIPPHLIEDARFQYIHRNAINAYRFYTEGIC